MKYTRQISRLSQYRYTYVDATYGWVRMRPAFIQLQKKAWTIKNISYACEAISSDVPLDASGNLTATVRFQAVPARLCLFLCSSQWYYDLGFIPSAAGSDNRALFSDPATNNAYVFYSNVNGTGTFAYTAPYSYSTVISQSSTWMQPLDLEPAAPITMEGRCNHSVAADLPMAMGYMDARSRLAFVLPQTNTQNYFYLAPTNVNAPNPSFSGLFSPNVSIPVLPGYDLLCIQPVVADASGLPTGSPAYPIVLNSSFLAEMELAA